MRFALRLSVLAASLALPALACAQPVGAVGRLEGRSGTPHPGVSSALDEAHRLASEGDAAGAVAALRRAVDGSQGKSAGAHYLLAQGLDVQYRTEIRAARAATLDREVRANLRAAAALADDATYSDNAQWAARARTRLSAREAHGPLARAVRLDGREVREGDRGPAVAELQQLLAIGADGLFGPITRRALEAWQRSLGLPETGQVDARTLESLLDPTATLGITRSSHEAWDGGRRLGPIEVVEIDGDLVAVDTARAYLRMRAAALRDGIRLRIVSGFRSYAHQERLYRLYRAGRGNLAARPGYSNHQDGRALDLNTASTPVLRWLNRNAKRFGFKRTVSSEDWHWEYRP